MSASSSMNCDQDFYIPFNKTYVKVKPFCESSVTRYKVYLNDDEIIVQMYCDEDNVQHWREYNKGESELAKELGRLIEEQLK